MDSSVSQRTPDASEDANIREIREQENQPWKSMSGIHNPPFFSKPLGISSHKGTKTRRDPLHLPFRKRPTSTQKVGRQKRPKVHSNPSKKRGIGFRYGMEDMRIMLQILDRFLPMCYVEWFVCYRIFSGRCPAILRTFSSFKTKFAALSLSCGKNVDALLPSEVEWAQQIQVKMTRRAERNSLADRMIFSADMEGEGLHVHVSKVQECSSKGAAPLFSDVAVHPIAAPLLNDVAAQPNACEEI